MKNIIEIKNLHKYYFKRGLLFGKTEPAPALCGVDLAARQGTVLGLSGESGCGKTTLAKIILGLEPYEEGSVLLDGKNIRNIGKKEKALCLSAVFQDPYSSLDPRMSVRRIISEPFNVHGLHKDKEERKKILVSLLNSVGLNKEDLDRYPHQFSGGQRQRIALARALALNPKILIADEPTSALDVSVQAQVLNLLKDIKEKFNLTILFISHDIDAARFLCDDIAIMQNGRVVEAGPAEKVLGSPRQPYTKALLDAVPRIGANNG